MEEEYIETIELDGEKYDVYLDDYGQCYYFKYTDENGEIKEIGCGTYNFNYRQEIIDFHKWRFKK